jgi:ABC-2 type transport system permease protein
LQTIREKDLIFWSLLFPLILGTFFYMSFWKMSNSMGEQEDSWETIPVAVIEKDTTSQEAAYFSQFIDEINGNVIEIKDYSSEEAAITALQNDEITGVYYVDKEPSLSIAKSGINQSILNGMLDSYMKNAQIMMDIATDHPENIQKLMTEYSTMTDSGDYLSDVDLSGKTMNPMIAYFLALIAYCCISGAFMGVHASFTSQANLSALGARRSITPTKKIVLVLTDLAVLVLIHFVNIMILTLYVWKVLKIPLGIPIVPMLVTNLMGSIVGISLGIIIGATSKAGIGVKTGLTVLLTLLPAFLAGLMYGNMKNIIELHAPIINRINPAAVLSDTYYALGVFSDYGRYHRNILTLLAMSVLLLSIAFFSLRRERYDSI